MAFNQTANAASLNLMSYSVNHKEAVFERISENLKQNPKSSLECVRDQSITTTPPHTMFTEGRTFCFAAANSGRSDLASFTILQLVSTSSSIFTAAPIWFQLEKKGAESSPLVSGRSALNLDRFHLIKFA